MSLKCLKEKVKHEEDKMLKILLDYFKYKYVKHIKLYDERFRYVQEKNEYRCYLYSCTYISFAINYKGFYIYDCGFIIFEHKFLSLDESKDRNKKTNKNNSDMYNQIEYIIDNASTICNDMYNMYKTLHDTNNLNITNMFLLCNNKTRIFPRDIANIISNKILFFLFYFSRCKLIRKKK